MSKIKNDNFSFHQKINNNDNGKVWIYRAS